jgi:enamine deaminase RidA (YjgF/YER057c/UK114 family)
LHYPHLNAISMGSSGPRSDQAGSSLTDVVSIRQWLLDADDIPGYVAVRSTFITHQAASMLAVIPALVRPDFLVEIEVIAAVVPEGWALPGSNR